ncbi:hypothetical protein V496_00560 [Pseudogymnoascus sp. VKM F-4515 (FW-2607)]|nr:hypothetical protein V496_00560 [Pseudogymnoascus sp. VKM F-4515 (FW-2607)]
MPWPTPERLFLDNTTVGSPTRETYLPIFRRLSKAVATKLHASSVLGANASLKFIGTATTILEWEGIRLMTDPNFLHKGDHVQKGLGAITTRMTDPAMDLYNLPRIDVVLVSHYHEEHFDRAVERDLRRSIPIIATAHAKAHLTSKDGDGEAFTAVYTLDTYQSTMLETMPNLRSHVQTLKTPALKVTAMPAKHVSSQLAADLNFFNQAAPPVTGWMLELGYFPHASAINDVFECGYRIYITGDTLLVDELEEMRARYAGRKIDLMIIHLGGAILPEPLSPSLVSMDASQGLQLVQLIRPDLTIPIHYDDYDIFKSPLKEFKDAVKNASLEANVVYLERGEEYRFKVR